MNIVVLLRVGRDPASFTVNHKAQKIFVHRDEYRINPSDLNALEAALQMAGTEHSVVAISIGGPEVKEALYQARAMGAARALWVTGVSDPDAAQIVTLVEAMMVGYLEDAEILFLGATVPHADLAQVAPRLAAALEWTFVDNMYKAQLVPNTADMKAIVSSGNGFQAVLIAWSVVLAVATDANRPRFAPAPAIIRTYADPAAVEVVSAATLGLDESSLKPQVARHGEGFSPERGLGQALEGAAEDVARQLAAALRD